jgi:hypothetical protein
MSADRSHTLEELRHWANVRKYRDQAISYLKLARMTADPERKIGLSKSHSIAGR